MLNKLKQQLLTLQAMIDKNKVLIERSHAILAKGRELTIKQVK